MQGLTDMIVLANNLLHKAVLRKSQEWGSGDQLMYIVASTQAEKRAGISALLPGHFLLVPDMGA